MSEAQSPDVEPVRSVPETVPAQEFPISLDEFCALLSRTERSVEVIAVFHHHETVAGRMNDMASAYRGRFSDVLSRPVQ